MARKPAKVTTHFVEIEKWTARDAPTIRTYAVEERQGRTRRTIGRVYGGARSWQGLAVCGDAWSCRYPTRALALAALRRREDFRVVQAA